MTDANGTPVLPLAQELGRLIEQIEFEEQRCSQRAAELHSSGCEIELLHRHGVASHNALPTHIHLQELHGAMLKVHHKIRQRHQVATHQCRILLERFKAGQYAESEIAEAIRRLKGLYLQMKRENAFIEQERQKILAEHQAFLASLGCTTD